jgi:hypothetical protein
VFTAQTAPRCRKPVNAPDNDRAVRASGSCPISVPSKSVLNKRIGIRYA